MSLNCPFCYSLLDFDANYCHFCGVKINKESKARERLRHALNHVGITKSPYSKPKTKYKKVPM